MYKIMYMYVYSKKSCNLKMVKTFIQYIKKHKIHCEKVWLISSNWMLCEESNLPFGIEPAPRQVGQGTRPLISST